ncbi:MAG: RnfH family protein [Methylococcales symbiont of Hymedesmia sp. n. MRB-2018]|nr:MAG: RnfH family protein [Methylococcales symbiont of Hymedesmia sp. n. MRB-2018]KAF3984048.1 MAG: RnfH family protein [Methylococcales symbiont of Hymedesmia sp. n. MRB-2018]
MAEKEIMVEVAFAKADEQRVISVALSKAESVEEVIKHSAILQRFPEIDLKKMTVGVFGKSCSLAKQVEDGDRIEIYRPLFQNPMQARRNRAAK